LIETVSGRSSSLRPVIFTVPSVRISTVPALVSTSAIWLADQQPLNFTNWSSGSPQPSTS
jgi:hypothetical protein